MWLCGLGFSCRGLGVWGLGGILGFSVSEVIGFRVSKVCNIGALILTYTIFFFGGGESL